MARRAVRATDNERKKDERDLAWLAMRRGGQTAGVIADRFGTRRAFMSAIILFSLGSLLCAFSYNLSMLVASLVVLAPRPSLSMAVDGSPSESCSASATRCARALDSDRWSP